jgi:hypothetical protein
MHKSGRTILIFTTGAFILMALMLQARPFAAEFEVNPTEIADLSFFPLTAPQLDRKFSALFDRRGESWKYFSPYVVVLSNQSQQPIDAVTLEWTITDAAGKTATTYTTWEGYFDVVIQALGPDGRGAGRGGGGSSIAVILNRRAQLLMTPTECEPTRICGNSAAVFGSLGSGFVTPDGEAAYPGLELKVPQRSYVQALGNARKVSVVLDTVIFSNGLVKGPDRSRTSERLEARDAATKTLVARGLVTPDAELQAMLATASLTFSESNLKDLFSGVLARTAAGSRDPRQTLTLYRSLVPLPKFHRE